MSGVFQLNRNREMDEMLGILAHRDQRFWSIVTSRSGSS